MKEKTERIFLFDVLNVISCIGVIWLHVNGAVWTFSYLRTWVTSWLLETLLYWPVPIFFMLSGITLLDYRNRYDTRTFMKKRLVKTAVPFVFWSVISIFWSIHISGYLPSDTKISVCSMADMIINCKGMSIYWFFPALFSVYLSIPILSLAESEKRNSIYSYILIYGLITVSLLPFITGLLKFNFNADLRSPICGGYLIYILLGYLLWNTSLQKWKRYVIYFAGFAGWGIRFFGGWYLSYQAGGVDGTFSGYLNVPCVLQSAAVFEFFKQSDWSYLEQRFGTIIRKLSGFSFGVYLIHFYIMQFLIAVFQIPMSCWQWRIGGVFVTYLLSIGFVAFMKKVPVISYLVP